MSGPPIFHQETSISYPAKSLQFLFFLFGQYVSVPLSWQLSFVPRTHGVSAAGQPGKQQEGGGRSQRENEALYDCDRPACNCVSCVNNPQPADLGGCSFPLMTRQRPRAGLGGMLMPGAPVSLTADRWPGSLSRRSGEQAFSESWASNNTRKGGSIVDSRAHQELFLKSGLDDDVKSGTNWRGLFPIACAPLFMLPFRHQGGSLLVPVW